MTTQHTTHNKIITALFYAIIGTNAGIALFLLYYWLLLKTSTITAFFYSTQANPVYMWIYIVTTLAIVILFGVSTALAVYLYRRTKLLTAKDQSGTVLGGTVGAFAAACPVCGAFLLSLIGVTGGLASLPFAGLELKAAALGLIILSLWLVWKKIKKPICKDGSCPTPQPTHYKREDRDVFISLIFLLLVMLWVGWQMLQSEPMVATLYTQNQIINSVDNKLNNVTVTQTGNGLFDEITSKVLPDQGWQSKISLNESVIKLTEFGVIDKNKFIGMYQNRGGLPIELQDVLDTPSDKPILLTKENANLYVNLLWPIGLANYMSTNKESPINGESLFYFASTGGWTLGEEKNGGTYFNAFKIVELTAEQEALVTKIAKNTYRPCCNNSTYFQDCNHGSALLGLLQLGVAQGLTEDELYKEALAFNSFWFPNTYIQTALYFKAVEGVDWENVDPKVVMGEDFSTISGWSKNVAKEVTRLGLMPKPQGGVGCGI